MSSQEEDLNSREEEAAPVAKDEDQAADTPPDDAPPETDQEEGEEASNDDESGQQDTETVIEALTEERDKLKDTCLRTLADMDNLRKRTKRDMKQARKFALEGFSRDLLDVADNLERALAAAQQGGEEGESPDDPTLKGLVEGIVMVQNGLTRCFTKHGVTRIEALGQPFDPNLHQAVMQVPDAEAAPDTVVQEMQAGYLLNERLLRPAMVGVAKKP